MFWACFLYEESKLSLLFSGKCIKLALLEFLLNDRKRVWERNKDLFTDVSSLCLSVGHRVQPFWIPMYCTWTLAQVGYWKHLIADKYKLIFLISSIVYQLMVSVQKVSKSVIS